MPLFSTEAIVLSARCLGETDKLVTFFTEARGKISGVAKGARRFKNRFGAALEPLTQCHLVALETGRSSLAQIREVTLLLSFQKLRENWETLTTSAQMIRLLSQMTPEEEPHPSLYYLLQEALVFLEKGTDRDLSIILFMTHLIVECGYRPEWHHCVLCCQTVQTEERRGTIAFSNKEGGILCPPCAGASCLSLSPEALAFFRQTSPIDFRSADRLSLTRLVKREVETLLKDYISYLMGSKTKPFQSFPYPMPPPQVL